MASSNFILAASRVSKEERARRQDQVDFARGSVRLEGFVLGPEYEELNERYVAGEITYEDKLRATLDKWF